MENAEKLNSLIADLAQVKKDMDMGLKDPMAEEAYRSFREKMETEYGVELEELLFDGYKDPLEDENMLRFDSYLEDDGADDYYYGNVA